MNTTSNNNEEWTTIPKRKPKPIIFGKQVFTLPKVLLTKADPFVKSNFPPLPTKPKILEQKLGNDYLKAAEHKDDVDVMIAPSDKVELPKGWTLYRRSECGEIITEFF